MATESPAIAGIVDLETPPAIALASPPPVMANRWKTSIIPVIVPNNPKSGATPTHNFIKIKFWLIFDEVLEIKLSLMAF